MPAVNEINLSISRGVKFLHQSQQKTGAFPSITSNDPSDFYHKDVFLCESNFLTSIIYLAINDLNEPIAVEIKNKIIQYLVKEKSNALTFNYWSRESEMYKKMPYPDDLDDTFCALSALFLHDNNFFSGEDLNLILNILTTNEIAVGGPYRTWIVGENADQAWLDADLAVNANIGYFLSLLQISLPKINSLIKKAATAQRIESPYYPTQFPIYYFISRFYKSSDKKIILEQLDTLANKAKENNVLNIALYLNTRMNFKCTDKLSEAKALEILKNQNEDGSWPAFAFYAGINPNSNSEKYFEGSESLTTALCVEALSKYAATQKKDQADQRKSNRDLKKKILLGFKSEIDQTDIYFNAIITKFANKLLKSNVGDQVIFLPEIFKKSLTEKYAEKVNDHTIVKLGVANLFGWIAYTIYDDFYDKEGQRELLPVGNIALRKLTSIFDIETKGKKFGQIFDSMMDRLDAANFVEIRNQELRVADGIVYHHEFDFGPNYIRIADKSIGHILGPLYIVIENLGFRPGTDEYDGIYNGLRRYLSAKQLNDDAHDWEEDLRNGKLTAVVDLLFKDFKKDQINLDNIQPVREFYWQSTILKICDLVKYHLEESKKLLAMSQLLTDNNEIFGLIDDLDNIREKTIRERKKMISFVNSYENSK